MFSTELFQFYLKEEAQSFKKTGCRIPIIGLLK